MEDTIVLYSFVALLFLLISLHLMFGSKRRRKNLPPSPPSLPIIGHFHLLKQPIHRFYQSLSQKYGPVFSLRLGSRLMVVVSSSSVAEECFTLNDIVLANRPKSILAKHLTYNYTMVTNAPYGDHWRNLRRIGAIEIFSSSRLNAYVDARRDEIRRLVLKLSRDSRRGFKKADLNPMITDLAFNNIMRMVAGKRYYGDELSNEAEAREFKEVMEQTRSVSGISNPADFFPILKWFIRGFEKKAKEIAKRMDILLQKMIDEQRMKRKENCGNMIDHLLSLQESEPQYYTDEIIKGLIMVSNLVETFLDK